MIKASLRTSLLLSTIVLAISIFHSLDVVDGKRIVAVGDLHGDLNQTLSILRLGRLIDKSKRWIGQDTIFVQLGDILDVGPGDLDIVRLLMRLEKEAEASGGRVVELLGNHELRNFAGDFSAVDPGALMSNGGSVGRAELLSNRTALGMYLRTRRAIFHEGPYLFMHGGFSTATAKMITNVKKVEEFNSALRQALVNGSESEMAANGMSLNEDNVDDVQNPILVRSILNVQCDDLVAVLDKKFKGINSVIVGHVPHNPMDFDDWRLCGGRLIDIDFGLSRWKKGDPGHVALLEIDTETNHIQLIESSMSYPEWMPDKSGVPRHTGMLLQGWRGVVHRIIFVVGAVTSGFVVMYVLWQFIRICCNRPKKVLRYELSFGEAPR